MKNRSCMSHRPKDAMLLANAGLDRYEVSLLTIMRYFFQSFAQPHSQGWLQAFRAADTTFPQDRAAGLAMACLTVVQNMRASRRDVFRFSNPDCPGCRAVLCTDERHLVGSVTALRHGNRALAQTHALLLCEGNDTAPMLRAAQQLANLLDDVACVDRQGLGKAV